MPVSVTRDRHGSLPGRFRPGPGCVRAGGWKALAGPVRPGLAGHSQLPAADCPGAVAAGDSEHAEAGQVDRGGKQAEVGGDLNQPADPRAAAAHQVGAGLMTSVAGNAADRNFARANRRPCPASLLVAAFCFTPSSRRSAYTQHSLDQARTSVGRDQSSLAEQQSSATPAGVMPGTQPPRMLIHAGGK